MTEPLRETLSLQGSGGFFQNTPQRQAYVLIKLFDYGEGRDLMSSQFLDKLPAMGRQLNTAFYTILDSLPMTLLSLLRFFCL